MHLVMYCPGMPFHGGTIAEGGSLGGSESAAYYLARELARLGHQVTVFTTIPREAGGSWEGVRYLSAGPPTEQAPMGADFSWYAASTPHDALILQRVPDGFRHRTAAKVNLWWSHDLALKRHQPRMVDQLWNVDRVLAVSDFHREQIAAVYGIPSAHIAVVPNAIDETLFAPPPSGSASSCTPGAAPAAVDEAARKRAGGRLVYSSRPERGLELLVGAGGVMERLAERAPELTLHVAGYENTTPAMRPLYEALWRRCRELPNVELLGPLSKKELADLMRAAWLHCYPTLFEEVSCISAMEAQAAGTPVVTSRLAALPETLAAGGAVWLEPRAETLAAECAEAVLALRDDPARWERLHAEALAQGRNYRWRPSAEVVAQEIASALRRRSGEPYRLARHLLRHSDIVACEALVREHPGAAAAPGMEQVRRELQEHYAFLREGAFGAHYEAFAQWQIAHKVEGGFNDPERLLAMPRIKVVADLVAALPSGARVLDYGCGQGHVAAALAGRFPALEVTGMDLAPAAVAAGTARLGAEAPPNLRLLAGDAAAIEGRFDLIVACEVAEHVPEPGILADDLEAHLAPGGTLCLTVPYGPWEAESFATVPYRSHLHHLERADLEELFGHKPGYRVVAVPVRATEEGEPLGTYRITFQGGGGAAGRVNMARKLSAQAPRETVSVCMICGDDGNTLARTLESVRPFADQIVIGIDCGEPPPGGEAAAGPAWEIARRFGAESFPIPSPLATGFAAARNRTLERARCDWVLWIDDDEVFEWPERLAKYLRPNPYDAYAIRQHHYAVEPEGLIKTDFPCRLFRRGRGFRFHGLVHEHPELGLNRGAGHVMLLPEGAICHNGYETESVRRRRFRRNLPLMVRDREAHPERVLGKFLWIRDLAHLNRYALEGGAADGPALRRRAEEAARLWRELLEQGHVRLAVDALPYYSEAVGMLRRDGIHFELAMGAACAGLGDLNGHPPPLLRGTFLSTADIRLLTEKVMEEKTTLFEEKYL